jgi:hypothetical protein
MTDRINDRDGQSETPQPLAFEQTAKELARQFQDLMSDPKVREFARQLQAVKEGIAESLRVFHERYGDFAAQIRQTVEEIGKVDWRAEQERTDASLLRLAEVGWTVPDWFTPYQSAEIANCEPDLADEHFVECYFGSGADGIKRVRRRLEASGRMMKWKPLLAEALAALERGEHLITVPTFLLILEGYIAQFADRPAAVRDTNVRRLFAELRPEESPYTLGAIWRSTGVFISRLFSSADFTADNPGFINRHWILHGRAATDWTQADALRLLNALNTLDWLIEMTERTGPAERVP